MPEAYAPPSTLLDHGPFATAKLITCALTADQKEFTKICQAVGTGFVVMGVVGYVVKLSTYRHPIVERYD